MYPVKLGYGEAVKRINQLLKNGHAAEALLTSVFTAEKTLRRTLKQLVVSAGFPSKPAEKMVNRFRGLEALKDGWEMFDPRQESLALIVDKVAWDSLKEAQTMRNNFVHGTAVYSLSKCDDTARKVLAALDSIVKTFDARYGYSGWTTVAIRYKSALHIDPKVKV